MMQEEKLALCGHAGVLSRGLIKLVRCLTGARYVVIPASFQLSGVLPNVSSTLRTFICTNSMQQDDLFKRNLGER